LSSSSLLGLVPATHSGGGGSLTFPDSPFPPREQLLAAAVRGAVVILVVAAVVGVVIASENL
jgi:hypothetical protein